MRRRMLWNLYPSYLATVLLALIAVAALTARGIRDFHIDQVREGLQESALLAGAMLWDEETQRPSATAQDLCASLGRRIDTRITLVLPSGEVVCDSDEDPTVMDNHRNRPEIMQAFTGEVGYERRYSDTLRQTMLYLGHPIKHDGKTVAVMRTSVPLTAVKESLRQMYLRILGASVPVLLGAALVGWVVARRLVRPLEAMRVGATRFASGELNYRLPAQPDEETAALAGSLNYMAEQLQNRIQALVRERNERQAILASMVEGVLAIDADEHVLEMNQAAADLLQCGTPGATRGRVLEELVRNAALQKLVERVLGGESPAEDDIRFDRGQPRFLQVHGTELHDEDGRRIGALVVLNDVTRLRRLESVRRDFVANVSHELKTPITSIKGFVESLQDGAVNDPEQRDKFLGIIARQTDTLNAIIQDLLCLARVEHDSESGRAEMQPAPVAAIIKEALEVASPKADDKSITITLACEEGLNVKANPSLLEQAVINLVENAVAYSEPGKEVRISSFRDGENAIIEVSDEGCGIEAQHLPRLFERFYRADKGRSRRQGGTGLGLAIVKHIVRFHGGDVTVESTPGHGSTFSLVLPSTTGSETDVEGGA